MLIFIKVEYQQTMVQVPLQFKKPWPKLMSSFLSYIRVFKTKLYLGNELQQKATQYSALFKSVRMRNNDKDVLHCS
jgi:hypothetical protein